MPHSLRIRSLGISGLRSIHRDQPVTLPLGLALGTAMSSLWGASGSGTSTILEGLELLAEAFVRDPKGSRLPLLGRQGVEAEEAQAPFHLHGGRKQVEFRVVIARNSQAEAEEENNEEERTENESREKRSTELSAYALVYAVGRHRAMEHEWSPSEGFEHMSGAEIARCHAVDLEPREPYLDLVSIQHWHLEAMPDEQELWELSGGESLASEPMHLLEWLQSRFDVPDSKAEAQSPLGDPLADLREALQRCWFMRDSLRIRSLAQPRSRQLPSRHFNPSGDECPPHCLHSDGSNLLEILEKLSPAHSLEPKRFERLQGYLEELELPHQFRFSSFTHVEICVESHGAWIPIHQMGRTYLNTLAALLPLAIAYEDDTVVLDSLFDDLSPAATLALARILRDEQRSGVQLVLVSDNPWLQALLPVVGSQERSDWETKAETELLSIRAQIEDDPDGAADRALEFIEKHKCFQELLEDIFLRSPLEIRHQVRLLSSLVWLCGFPFHCYRVTKEDHTTQISLCPFPSLPLPTDPLSLGPIDDERRAELLDALHLYELLQLEATHDADASPSAS